MGIGESIREFLDFRLGMFIHFGVYSLPGGEWNGTTIGGEQGEWIMNYLQIPISEYEKIASRFNPTEFDADEVAALARAAGMKYIVITAKHHDGFAMFRSASDPYNIHDWGRCGRDIVGELAAACRRQGLKLGLYYSQALDWHEPHAGGWNVKPYGLSPSWGNVWDFPDNSTKRFELYFEKKVKPQVTELLRNYGDIFLMWFDTPMTITAQQSDELYRLVKSLQPDCLVNSRIGNGKGDYGSLGDNEIPTVPLARPYESPMTLNDTWGFNRLDDNWKQGTEIIEMLAKLATRNVNFLINIGPTGSGEIPARSVEILKELAGWMAVNGRAIHGAAGNPSPSDFAWGYVTTRGRTLYAFIGKDGKQTIELNGLRTRVSSIACLGGENVVFEQSMDAQDGLYELSVQIPRVNAFLPVFAIECEDKPVFEPTVCQQGDMLALYPLHSRLYDGQLKDAPSVLMENAFTDYSAFGKMKIRHGGALAGWAEAGHWLEWNARFTQAGEYEVELIVNDGDFDWSDSDRCRVRVSVSGGGQTEAELIKSGAFSDSRYNKNGEDNTRAIASCGAIRIDAAGIKTIRLTLTSIPDGHRGIPLVALRFLYRQS